MSDVMVVTQTEKPKTEGVVDSSVLCNLYTRERCLDLLRERACQLGRHKVFIYREQPIVTANLKPRGAKGLEIRAWILP